MQEGKLPLPVQGYRLLAKLAVKAVNANDNQNNPHAYMSMYTYICYCNGMLWLELLQLQHVCMIT
jgi:hypothetical protein